MVDLILIMWLTEQYDLADKYLARLDSELVGSGRKGRYAALSEPPTDSNGDFALIGCSSAPGHMVRSYIN